MLKIFLIDCFLNVLGLTDGYVMCSISRYVLFKYNMFLISYNIYNFDSGKSFSTRMHFRLKYELIKNDIMWVILPIVHFYQLGT